MMRASKLDTLRAHLVAFFCTYPQFCRWLDRNQLDIGPGYELVRRNISDAHRHFCVIVGRWKLENWHVYRYNGHSDARTGGLKARWTTWDRIV